MHRMYVVEVLQLIASKSVQVELFEELEKGVCLPVDLLGKWKDVYRPDKTHFTNEFSRHELTQMHSFTEFYTIRAPRYPCELHELLVDPYWDSLCSYADELLSTFEYQGRAGLITRQ